MKLKFLHLFVMAAMLASLLSFTPTPAHAAGTITVNTATDDNSANQLCSLREAIIAANTDAPYQGCTSGSDIDTIMFSGNYTITLTSQLPTITSSMVIQGNGTARTIIQANANPLTATYRIMAINNTGILDLQNLTLRNGNCTGLCFGGGIFNGGALKISNSFIGGNYSPVGGAIFNSLDSDLSMENTQVNGNSSTNGGGIYAGNGSALIINNSRIYSNSADNDGGGIYLETHTTLLLKDSSFMGNDAQGNGAGIYNTGGNSILDIYGSTFWYNDAQKSGGGVYNLGSLVITNSTFYYNHAMQTGGGVHNGVPSPDKMSVYNSTFSDNVADTGGSGVYNAAGSTIDQFVLNILANSTGSSDCQNAGSISSDYVNLIETNGTGGSECGASTISADPMLGPLMDHGGLTPTMGLLQGSPAIDAGGCGQLIDQRGIARPQSTSCDLGAYEKNLSFADVPFDYWAWQYVESIAYAGITGGCGGGNYCPASSVTRGQMAVFLLKGMYGQAYTPSDATGTVFNDIPANHMFAKWIEQLAAEGITGGCGGGNYCPDAPVTREQMAVFLLVAKHGTGYTPPTANGVFTDVPTNNPFASWIEQLAAEGITGGCGGGNYCPSAPVNRGQMAVFLQTAFNLILP